MTPSPTAPTKSRTALAREAIRGRILRLEMVPGTVFSEGELAAVLGMGKTPVREALNLLTHESLVAVAPHSGYLVMPVTLRDIRELLELRLTIETLLARLAARRRDATAPRGLEDTADAWRRAAADVVAAGVPGRCHRSGSRSGTDVGPEPLGWLALGAALAERAGNGRAAEVEHYVLRHHLRHVCLAAALGDPRWPAPDHGALRAALSAGDPEAAASAVEVGVRALGAAVVAALVPPVAARLGRADGDGFGAEPPADLLDLDLGTLLRDG
ncbi:GntR family transcriptional regulator [Embleya sp. NPDC001921]